MPQPVVTFLSDYGLSDDFVGVCHAVIAAICPEARVIDLTHGVPRHDVRAGALILRRRCPTWRPACTSRWWIPGLAPTAARWRCGWPMAALLVGPDNGLLSLAAVVRRQWSRRSTSVSRGLF